MKAIVVMVCGLILSFSSACATSTGAQGDGQGDAAMKATASAEASAAPQNEDAAKASADAPEEAQAASEPAKAEEAQGKPLMLSFAVFEGETLISKPKIAILPGMPGKLEVGSDKGDGFALNVTADRAEKYVTLVGTLVSKTVENKAGALVEKSSETEFELCVIPGQPASVSFNDTPFKATITVTEPKKDDNNP